MTLAANQGLAAAKADICLDSAAQQESIQAALLRLEAIARDRGVAIGAANALPASISAIGRLARSFESRGGFTDTAECCDTNHQGGVAETSPMR